VKLRIERYRSDNKARWDTFIDQSRNGTFLFKRDYMEYHADRFTDHSLLFFDEDSLIAVLPANAEGQELYSHRGLSYGGFVVDNSMKLAKCLELFSAFYHYCQQANFKNIYYKTIPHIYPKFPSEEDLYVLFMLGAKLISRSMITVVTPLRPLEWQSQRKRAAAKAEKNQIYVRSSTDFGAYWELLGQLLSDKFDTKPVHSLEEILYLQSLFPENIKLYAAYKNELILAGVLVYESEQVARAQYIAASDEGKAIGALDLIFQHLLGNVYKNKPFFELGTSERKDKANYLNIGLINQKEGFGARAVAQDTYLIDLNHSFIDIVNDVLV
jgi:hypothetical protein